MKIEKSNLPSWLKSSTGRGFLCTGAVILILFLYLFLAIDTARRKSVHFDETAHIMSGFFMLKNGDYRLCTANLVLGQKLAALPLVVAHAIPPGQDLAAQALAGDFISGGESFSLGLHFLYLSGNDPQKLLILARLPMILLGLVTAALVFFWSRKLFGTGGGLVSLFFLATCPVFISLSGIASADMPATLFFLAATWSFWALLHRINPLTVALFGISAGLLLVAKLSSLVFGPVAIILLLIRIAAGRPIEFGWNLKAPGTEKSPRRIIQLLCIAIFSAAVIAYITIWSAYGFRFSAAPPSSTGSVFNWNELIGKQEILRLVKDNHMLPEAFLFDYSGIWKLTESRPSFLLGETSRDGWFYYFPFTFSAKTGLPMFIALLAVAVILLWMSLHSKNIPACVASWNTYELLPIIVFVGVYMFIMVTRSINIGHRHILPIYPFLYILLGGLVFAFSLKAVWPRIAMVFLMAASLITSAIIHPNHLSYVSPIFGGPFRGYRLFVDSSLEWGQELPALKKWLESNPSLAQGKRIYFSYFGSGSPEASGIKSLRLPGFFDPLMEVPDSCTFRERLKPGIYLISATMLQPVYYARMASGNVEVDLSGKWCKEYEIDYQQLRGKAEPFFDISKRFSSSSDKSGLQDWMKRNCPESYAGPADRYWLDTMIIYDLARFARLASWLRQRNPDSHINYSIYVFNLDEKDLKAALESEYRPDSRP